MENLFKKNPLQDLLCSVNAVISTNESTEFITGHVIYNLAYTYKFQLKTTLYRIIFEFVMFMEGFEDDTSEEDIKKALIETSRWFLVGIYKSNYLL